jgi:hypothetical protein
VPQWAQKPEVGGEPLPEGIRSAMAGPSGVGSADVRIHRDVPAADEAGIAAYTTGQHVSFGRGQYAPETKAGQHVIAHELAHVAQQRAGVAGPVQAYGDPIPTVSRPTVSSMADYIDLVRRIEAANPGRTALQIAQMIMRSKYFSRGFDWLLPSTAGAAGVPASGGVTAADVTTLSGEFDLDLSPSLKEDVSHVITAIVAAAEHSAPGSGGAGGLAGRLVGSLPSGLSQLDVAS